MPRRGGGCLLGGRLPRGLVLGHVGGLEHGGDLGGARLTGGGGRDGLGVWSGRGVADLGEEAGEVDLHPAEVAEQAVTVLAQALDLGLDGGPLGVGLGEHLLGRLASRVEMGLRVALGAGPDLVGVLLGLCDDAPAAVGGLLDQDLGRAAGLLEHFCGLGSQVLERRRWLVAQHLQLVPQVRRGLLGLLGADALVVEARGHLLDVRGHLLALATPQRDVEDRELAEVVRLWVDLWLEQAHGRLPGEMSFRREILTLRYNWRKPERWRSPRGTGAVPGARWRWWYSCMNSAALLSCLEHPSRLQEVPNDRAADRGRRARRCRRARSLHRPLPRDRHGPRPLRGGQCQAGGALLLHGVRDDLRGLSRTGDRPARPRRARARLGQGPLRAVGPRPRRDRPRRARGGPRRWRGGPGPRGTGRGRRRRLRPRARGDRAGAGPRSAGRERGRARGDDRHLRRDPPYAGRPEGR